VTRQIRLLRLDDDVYQNGDEAIGVKCLKLLDTVPAIELSDRLLDRANHSLHFLQLVFGVTLTYNLPH
jgi:hypothetical protein